MPARRQVLAAFGAAGLAGCSIPRQLASRDERSTLRSATSSVPEVDRGIRVSDAHLREARETFRAFRRRLAEREEQLDPDTHVKPVDATPDGDWWHRVEQYRRWTFVVAARYADLFRDPYADDDDDIRARLGDAEGATVDYDGGAPRFALAQLAVADDRLVEASGAVERGYEALAEAGRGAFAQSWLAELYVRDARHLAAALPDDPSHAEAFRDAYDSHRDALLAAREDDRVFAQFYDAQFEDLARIGPGDVMLSVAEDARESGRLARALRFVLLGRLAHTGQRRLTRRLERMEPRPDARIAPERIAEAGDTAHETLRAAADGDRLTRSLCHLLAQALERTDERVTDLADDRVRDLYEDGGLDQRALRPLLLSYLAIAAMTERATDLGVGD